VCAQAFFAALTSYWLARFLPLWGLSLVAVSMAYLGPLVYIGNKEFIDAQIDNVQDMINSQASQVKEMAEQHTAHATDIVKQYVGDYRAKAHEYIGSVRSRPASPLTEKVTPFKDEPGAEPTIQQSDFPTAPKDEPVESKPESNNPEPLLAS
jgi:hypothetical protein